MKRTLVLTVFLLATLAWAAAQQSVPQSGSQSTPPSTQPGASQSPTPGASQSSPSTPSAAGQAGSQSSATGMSNSPVTEGCLGGSASAFTITDKAGKSYKLNLPANADASPLASHIGESVMVQGNVNSTGSPSIDVQRIGRGTGTCSGSSSAAPQQH
jgi:hypothetical protein